MALDPAAASKGRRPLDHDAAGWFAANGEPLAIARAARFVLPPEPPGTTYENSVSIEAVRVAALLAERGLLRLPAPKVWLERDDQDEDAPGTSGYYVVSQDEEGYVVTVLGFLRDFRREIRPAPVAVAFDRREPPVVLCPAEAGSGHAWNLVSAKRLEWDDEVGEATTMLLMTAYLDLIDLLVTLAAEPGLAEASRSAPRPAPGQRRDRDLLPAVAIAPTAIRRAIERHAEAARARPPSHYDIGKLN